MYNMDEKDFAIGVLNKARRVFSSQNPLKGAGQDGNRAWITVIAGICADGSSIPPAIIYHGLGLQDSWLEDWQPESQEVYFTATPTGWANDEVGLSWLSKNFERSTKEKACQGREWRLLRQIPTRLNVRKLHNVADTSSRSAINRLLLECFARSYIPTEHQRKISSTIHQLSTQVTILTSQISGLR
ncbi:hypothetical protein K402DRAFT_441443, partial [Aulographum hederae CBS 113979]